MVSSPYNVLITKVESAMLLEHFAPKSAFNLKPAL